MDVHHNRRNMDICYDTMAPMLCILPWHQWHQHPQMEDKEIAIHAEEIYQETIGAITPMANLILHKHNLNTMINWTKQHLDAYLATAEVLRKWNVEPR